jgi:hypothetical protein
MTSDPGETERAEARAERGARAERRKGVVKAERRKALREWLAVGLVLVVGVVVLWQSFHSSAVTSCQAAYNNAFAANLVQRAALTDRDHKATTGLIEGVFAPPKSALKSPEARAAYFRALFVSYKHTETEITAARRAHPFPQLPSKACR